MKKIAVSSQGQDLESKIDPRFGRCMYFLIVDVDNKQTSLSKIIQNPYQNQGGGAGISSAQLVGNEKVEAVITGNVGPNAYQVLNSLKIDMYSGSGKIKDAIDDYIRGNLTKL